uniref:Uncharacterized protein n=1 Tax=Solanum tuberosum TaxID=4113 RepID=M1A4I3_SOLTU
MKSPRWGYVRIISGTIFGGILGFYLMHRAELQYKVLRSSFSYSRLNCLRQRAIICINYCYVIEGNVEREIEEV